MRNRLIISAVLSAAILGAQAVTVSGVEITGIGAGFIQLFTGKGKSGPSVTIAASEVQIDTYTIVLPANKPTVDASVLSCPPPNASGLSACKWVPLPTMPQSVTIPPIQFSTTPIQIPAATVPAQTVTIPAQTIALK